MLIVTDEVHKHFLTYTYIHYDITQRMQINVISYLLIMLTTRFQYYADGLSWPSGSYGLPRPITGCPNYWKEGVRYQDTEDEHSNNKKSGSYHLSGSVNRHGVRQEFCTKEDSVFDEVGLQWPDGQYCIYKYGSECPEGLHEGWVFWDDENIEELDGGNMVQGVVPEGVYEKDTLIYFCCNNKGIKSKPIELPLNNQFYLLAYRSAECQQVKGAKVTSEFVQWDDEDRGNTNAHSKFVPYGVELDSWNTRIFYCYYDTGICGKHGTFCRNSTIDDSFEQEKSVIVENPNYDKEKSSTLRNFLEKRTKGHSAVAVAIGCSVAGIIVGTALTVVLVKRYLNAKLAGYNSIKVDRNDEESFPLPDHIW